MRSTRHPLLLAVCCTAQFMVILDVAIVNVALPTIRTSLGFSTLDLPWVVNAYTIAFAGLLMLGGRAADIVGQRRVLIAGLLVFALASLLGGTAVSPTMLVIARAAQGAGAAMMAPASLAAISAAFPAGAERMRAIGLWGSMNGAGGAAGTLLGGLITQELGWRWILLINLPIGIAAALLARAVLQSVHRRDGGGFDLAGAMTVTGGLLAVVWGILAAGMHGWGSPQALGPIAGGLALLCAFVAIEQRLAVNPLVPLRVFANRLLCLANVVVLLFSAALFPMWYLLSLYLQEVLRFKPLGAGLAFLPMALTIMACATYASRLVSRYGAGTVLGAGLSSMALGMALLGRIAVDGGYLKDVMVPAVLVAVGIGFSIVPSTIAATAAAREQAGLAAGLVNTSRQIGGALGLALLTSLAASYTRHLTDVDLRAPVLALTDGYRLAFLIGAGFAAVGAMIALRWFAHALRAARAVAPPPGGREAVATTRSDPVAGAADPIHLASALPFAGAPPGAGDDRRGR